MVEVVVLSRRYAEYTTIGLLRRHRSNIHLDQTGHHVKPGTEHFRAYRSDLYPLGGKVALA